MMQEKEVIMLKKVFVFLCTILLFLGLTLPASASPVPFQISGGSLDANWSFGGGIFNYTPSVMSAPVWLDEGESEDVTFGSVNIPKSFGTGQATFTVDFLTPLTDGSVEDTGDFAVISWCFFTLGAINFGDPEEFAYSYNGISGGAMTVGFDDIKGIQCGTWIPITGTITNTNSVPEPATMLLFGSGLVGLAGFRRKLKK
jgi:hypothetical protein